MTTFHYSGQRMTTQHINIITSADATRLGLSNWIGTLGRGRRSIDAREVKTQKQAEAWLHRVISSGGQGVFAGAFVWQERDYKGNACGWAAALN